MQYGRYSSELYTGTMTETSGSVLDMFSLGSKNEVNGMY